MVITESAALAGLGWVASPVISKLVNDSISYLGSDLVKDIAEDLETTILPLIQPIVKAAEHSLQQGRIVPWLVNLKNAYLDAEAILHELEYERLKRKAKGIDKKLLVRLSSKPIIKPLVKFLKNNSPLLSPQKRMLLQKLNVLKEVAAESKTTFGELLGISNTQSTDGYYNCITSSILACKVFGRDGERDEIIKFLLDRQGGSSSRKCYSVVAITGMGGAGKTTLAQYIYNDPRVMKHFPTRMWLCISTNLDIIERTKEMIKCVPEVKCPDLQNLSALQNKLIESLPKSGNIMVVLDDILYDREAVENQWDDLLAPFVSRGVRCKIIITSRSTLFPFALLPEKLIELSDLAHDDFNSLFLYHAIDSSQQMNNEFIDIAKQISKKTSKSPVVAEIVGKQLRARPDIGFWRDTLEDVDLSYNMEILLLSFHSLDVQLQRCISFCSVFPKGTRFGLDSLVPYWVALDFIQSSDENRNVEDIGMEYFEIMVANSIFRLVDKTYIMDNLFHDLAEKLSVGDCFRVTNDEREIPSSVQHVYLKVNNENLIEKLSSICKLSNLRTLILGNQLIDDIGKIIPIISTNFKNLRILDVWSRCYTSLPPKIGGCLRNLRLLNFWKCSIEGLPDKKLQLYHLQFLLLPSSVKTLPRKFSNFIKLRCIEMYNSDGSQVNTLPRVPYLGNLTSLQHLNEFHVSKEKGYELQQLGRLKEIGGSLRIVNLENVRDKDEALKARLTDKSKLKRLHLVWSESVEINGLEIDIIDALQPPAKLEMLIIDGYMGSRYPTWLQEGSFRENIKCVKFYNCNALTFFSPNFHQFHYCSELIINNLGALNELSTFPEKLAELSIVKCPHLILICENELKVVENELQVVENELQVNENQSIGGGNELQDILNHELKSFEQTCSKESCAEQLKIMESIVWDNAPELMDVNSAWWHCHQRRMNFIFRLPPKGARENKLKLPSMLRILRLGYCCVSDETLSDCLRGIATLEELYLDGIMTITTLPPAQIMKPLKNLRVVEIKHCWYLRSLGGLHELPHLKCFIVEDCWGLKFESGSTTLPPTLQSFIIKDCTVPQAIFTGKHLFLQNVVIENCHVPGALSLCQLIFLESIALSNCPNLFSIRGNGPHFSFKKLDLLILPNLTDVDSWQYCQELFISSSVMLSELLASQGFVPPEFLGIKYCEEEEISFDKSDHLQHIMGLGFFKCKTLRLPKTLSDFSALEEIGFEDCSELSWLPDLPGSVQRIRIRGCPLLRDRCQRNGQDWHKIQRIQHREIE